MQNAICAVLLFVCAPAWGTSIAPMDLNDVLKVTDVVVIGREIGVDMIDGKGQPLTNPNARTGPGSANTLRSEIQIDKVLYNKFKTQMPEKIRVPHWQMWHMTLQSARDSLNVKPTIYLLKRFSDGHFEYAARGQYSYEVGAQERILDMLKKGVDRCTLEKLEFRMEELNEEEPGHRMTGLRDVPTAYLLTNSYRLQLETKRTTIQKRDGTSRELCVAPVGVIAQDQVWWMRNSKTKMLFQVRTGPKSKLALVDMKTCKSLWESKPFNQVTVGSDSVKIAGGPALKITETCELKPRK